MIEVRNLVKRYGDREAVRGVSFTVEKGKIYGFLGPNGAGKSTTMNIITGCLAATEGEVTVNGFDIYEDAVEAKSCIGYLPEQPPLYLDMTVEEYLAFVGQAKGLRGEKLEKAVDRAVEKTSLSPVAERLIKNLSKGYRQRVGIAQAIINDPEVVILDEPTVGLDPRQIIEIRDLIRKLGQDHTVILSSHILTEISAVCDYVIIMSKGRIVASDTIEHLTQTAEGKSYIDLVVRGEEKRVRAALTSPNLPGAESVDVKQEEQTADGRGTCRVRVSCGRNVEVRDAIFFRCAEERLPILAMNSAEVTLEKVFLELTADHDTPEPEDSPYGDEKAARRPDLAALGFKMEEDAGNVPDGNVRDEDIPDEDIPEEDIPVGDSPKDAVSSEEPGKENPADTRPSEKSGKNPDDYTPLFGGR